MRVQDAEGTVADWLLRYPGRSRVFEELGIDYCCGGKRPLVEACLEKGLDPEEIMKRLRRTDDRGGAEESTDWRDRAVTDLIDHIETVHHHFLRRELPRLKEMAAKVNGVHGKRHTALSEIETLFVALKAELEAHMLKEERVLFPSIRQLTMDGPSSGGRLGGPIQEMMFDHDEAGRALARLRKLSSDYTPPADACNTYRALMHGLQELEHDLHQHIHEENNILFPRALEEVAGSAPGIGSELS